MKKIISSVALLLMVSMSYAQFKITVKASDSFSSKPVYLYSLSGSKDYLESQTKKSGNQWVIKVPNEYMGMMRLFFPGTGRKINLIAENKDVTINLDTKGQDITKINFLDDSNQDMQRLLKVQEHKQKILPILLQIRPLYSDGSTFDKALKSEISNLENKDLGKLDSQKHPFISFYLENNKYASSQPDDKLNKQDYIDFFMNSGEMLETSSLLKPALINFLRMFSRPEMTKEVDSLLEKVNIESPRGQTILSELLDIFDTYSLNPEKDKYYQLASHLSCTINRDLSESLAGIKNTEIGGQFPECNFTDNVKHTKAKKLSDIKSKQKLVMFYSSTCPHCVAEFPKMIESYDRLKKNGIELIGLSIDSDLSTFNSEADKLPWITDTELGGWDSSYVKKYNIHGTPTFFLLDADNKIIAKPRNFEDYIGTAKLN